MGNEIAAAVFTYVRMQCVFCRRLYVCVRARGVKESWLFTVKRVYIKIYGGNDCGLGARAAPIRCSDKKRFMSSR